MVRGFRPRDRADLSENRIGEARAAAARRHLRQAAGGPRLRAGGADHAGVRAGR